MDGYMEHSLCLKILTKRYYEESEMNYTNGKRWGKWSIMLLPENVEVWLENFMVFMVRILWSCSRLTLHQTETQSSVSLQISSPAQTATVLLFTSVYFTLG